MKLYFKYLSLQLKSAFEYRASLVFDMISSALSTIATFFGIVLLFQKYDSIGGYSMNEVLITYAVVIFSFSIAECLFRGFDRFDKLIVTGEFDRLLIRPRSIFLQVLGYKVEFNKVGRIIFSGIILVFALVKAGISWTFMRVLTVVLMVLGSVIITAGLFLIYSGVSIFTIEGLEVMNVLTNGGRDLSQYPIDVYGKEFKRVFTYLIPLGVVNYVPLHYLLGMQNATLLNALAPLFSILFFGLCYLFFRWAITKYKSTGS